MVGNLIIWFMAFGLSFLVQYFGWTDQGTAFVCTHLGLMLIGLIYSMGYCYGCQKSELAGDGLIYILISSLVILLMIGIRLLISWIAACLIPAVDFTVAYQLVSIGRAFTASNKE